MNGPSEYMVNGADARTMLDAELAMAQQLEAIGLFAEGDPAERMREVAGWLQNHADTWQELLVPLVFGELPVSAENEETDRA